MEEDKNIRYIPVPADQFYSFAEDQEDNSIDIMKYVRKLLANWKKILVGGFVGAVIGLIIGFTTPRTYTASATLAPELSSKSGGSSSLSSLASLAGINLNSGSSSSAITPDLVPQIVNSNPFIVDMFSIPVQCKYKKEEISTDYYTYLKEYNKGSLVGAVLGAPMKALSWFIGLFKEKQPKVEGYANVDPLAMTFEQEKIAGAIRKSISVSTDKKTYIVSLSTTAQDPLIARQIADSVITKISEYISTYKTKKACDDLQYYEKLCGEAKSDYYKAQQAYAHYSDINQGIVLQSRRTEAERLSNEMQLKFNLYNACAQQVQQAQAVVQQSKPMFTVIDPASTPTKPSSASKAKTLVIWFVLGLFAVGAWYCFIDYVKEWLKKLSEDPEDSESKIA